MTGRGARRPWSSYAPNRLLKDDARLRTGGANKILLHRPAGAAMRAMVSGGASELIFDDQRPGSVGGSAHFSSPGFNEAVDRYEVRFSGGASQITIDTVQQAAER